MKIEVYILYTIIAVISIFFIIIIELKIKVDREKKEQKALAEIAVGMKKTKVDELLGKGQLEKKTKTYIQYRYLQTIKLDNISFSRGWSLKSGRTYYHNKKSYLLIKFLLETMEVIEIINKL